MTDKIRNDVNNCRRHLRERYGMHIDLQMVSGVIASIIKSKAMEEITSMFANYSGPQLAEAAEILAEIEHLEAASEGGEQ